jgi:hypothetical protein
VPVISSRVAEWKSADTPVVCKRQRHVTYSVTSHGVLIRGQRPRVVSTYLKLEIVRIPPCNYPPMYCNFDKLLEVSLGEAIAAFASICDNLTKVLSKYVKYD